ncbi:MAG: hypothetical protein PHT94_04505 [Candidatus Nanoarchaeia archaeon]|nr:hypothetical protein [Candidatus Nanoarchaeia archaeon]
MIKMIIENNIIYLILMISLYFIVGFIGNILSIETSEEQNFFSKKIKKIKNISFYLLILYSIYIIRNDIFHILILILFVIIFHILVFNIKINITIPITIMTYSFSFIYKDYYGIIFNLIFIMFYYCYTTSLNLLDYAKKNKIKLETDTKFKSTYLNLLFNNFNRYKRNYIFFIITILLYFI